MSLAASAPRHRFSVDDYHRMVDAGLLGEDDRVELLEGDIIDMSPIGSRHAACVDRLTRLLTIGLSEQAIVRVQGPIRLDELSEPQPDVAVLRRRDDFYATALPGPDDVMVVVEVADTTLAVDREVKAPLYGACRRDRDVDRRPRRGRHRGLRRYRFKRLHAETALRAGRHG